MILTELSTSNNWLVDHGLFIAEQSRLFSDLSGAEYGEPSLPKATSEYSNTSGKAVAEDRGPVLA